MQVVLDQQQAAQILGSAFNNAPAQLASPASKALSIISLIFTLVGS